VTSITQDAEAPPRRRMTAPERREAILGAARDAFAEGSYHEISLDRVAEGAGISKALIYEHFPSKRDLHRALLESYFGELLERVVGAIAGAEPGEGRLRAGLDAFLAFVEERRGAWRMLVLNMADPVIAERMERLRHEVAVLITARMVEEGPPGRLVEGLGRERAIEMVAQQIVGAGQSLANWWVEHPDVERARVLEVAMDFMWVGLRGVEQGERWDGPASP
jgi:AcrR family transcriptional regulator